MKLDRNRFLIAGTTQPGSSSYQRCLARNFKPSRCKCWLMHTKIRSAVVPGSYAEHGQRTDGLVAGLGIVVSSITMQNVLAKEYLKHKFIRFMIQTPRQGWICILASI